MRETVALALALGVALVAAAEPPLPAPRGFVTDLAGVLSPEARARVTRVAEELQAKTGAEIAVLTVDSTAPLDDFTYAMRVAEAWKPGRGREDTGLLVLVAVKDRKLRVLTGYGLEGVLPDGLVGQIQDEEIVPAFRAGRFGDGIERGVRAFAGAVAAEKGVPLTGVPPPRPRAAPLPAWVALLVLLALVGLVIYVMTRPGARAGPRLRRGGFGGYAGGFGHGGLGGGFGGFGGGSFGGGGAGRSW